MGGRGHGDGEGAGCLAFGGPEGEGDGCAGAVADFGCEEGGVRVILCHNGQGKTDL